MRVWILVVALGACSFSARPGSAPNDASAADPDGEVVVELDGPPVADAAMLDATVQPVCVGSFVQVCVDPPREARTVMTQKIDTTNSTMCAAYASTPPLALCVITGTAITLPAGNTVTVVGNRPLVLLSTSAITIDGTLDAASKRARDRDGTGPGADTGPCPSNSVSPTTGLQGGGGFGGSFGTGGGNGGNAPTGFGGIAGAAPNITTLTGGCPGGSGANNAFGSGRGGGGHSGGAVLLVAPQTITVSSGATINASGRGGDAGRGSFTNQGGGGGGGGSGGMIAFDGDTVTLAGKCFANGGGGAEGSGHDTGRDGGESTAPDTKARGGGSNSGNSGGDGGDGAGNGDGASPGNAGAAGPMGTGTGGGGAGGGAGVIKIVAAHQTVGGGLSPLPR